ncbi:hypothetical protein ACH4MA_20850 [Streptomyces roseolus]|uniref:hypothetical protein n=1 Tax=Streptomyces roseolus TaxID=67358 RepID=UPI00379ED70F
MSGNDDAGDLGGGAVEGGSRGGDGLFAGDRLDLLERLLAWVAFVVADAVEAGEEVAEVGGPGLEPVVGVVQDPASGEALAAELGVGVVVVGVIPPAGR